MAQRIKKDAFVAIWLIRDKKVIIERSPKLNFLTYFSEWFLNIFSWIFYSWEASIIELD
jgi:hypothetical protein